MLKISAFNAEIDSFVAVIEHGREVAVVFLKTHSSLYCRQTLALRLSIQVEELVWIPKTKIA